MDIRRLTLFVRVYETGSLTEAAREEFVSRQAVSKTVAQLEEELGGLFTRLPRGVRPTDLARAVYPHAKRAVEACTAIEEESRRFARGMAGSLRLAVEANAALTLPLDLMATYRENRPGVDLQVVSLPGGMALDQLRENRVDAVVAGPAPDAALSFEPIFSSTLSVVFSAQAFGEPADGNAERPATPEPGRALALGPQALEGKTIFGVAPDNYVERLLVPYLAEQGIAANLTFDINDTMLATNKMEAGEGGVIVEDSGAGRRFGDARYAHVHLDQEGAPRWQVGVVYRADAPCAPVARDFAAFARSYATRSDATV